MTDLSASRHTEYKAKNKIRFVTAASLFDGHDAAINIMRRILQASGAEVIHLGHNRSVEEVVTAALQEDVQGLAVSSYQGGHVEYFKYMIDLLRERGGENIKVFGGGGGVIVADEIRELQAYGVARIYTPEDGQKMGLQGMINDMLERCDEDLSQHAPKDLAAIKSGERRALARFITALENGTTHSKLREQVLKQAEALSIPTLGVTGTGGSGKSSLADELVRRFRLDKIDMLDFADFVAINKFDRKGGEDALRDVRKQYQRNRKLFDRSAEEMPVYGTIASRFNDDGVTALYQGILAALAEHGLKIKPGSLPPVKTRASSARNAIVPPSRSRYLAEVADTVRGYHARAGEQSRIARERQQLLASKAMLAAAGSDAASLDSLIEEKDAKLDARSRQLIEDWPETKKIYAGEEHVVRVRKKEIRTRLNSISLSGTKLPKVALPGFEDHGEILKWRMRENLPGSFPFTAGVFSFKRENEDPTRMFAGEGDPFRTNRRFHLLSKDMPAKRLSTAFDSVTLYGFDPDLRPDCAGRVGNSGVSIATLEDMKALYSGFDLCDPATSVSMTINGPAPTILAMFLDCAVDQQIDKFRESNGREPTAAERGEVEAWTLSSVRGTVQADILKEDQGQNTCIFSTEFSIKVMGDVQEDLIEHERSSFYSASISGSHIAEAGANPISQLAFTLANGFTFVEAYLARGMKIDDFAPNLSFFFSYGMEPEYAVLGRVARRIWAIAMKNRYGGNERSQKLKFHSQTSGRSLHAQEIAFNDIRTTLQALISTYDNTNSLHTNAYDEAITTPTEESVRRAMAIQMIINKEWGVAKNENPNQGSYIIEALTDLVEEAVLKEFEAISERGGVLGAMETGYQRGKIQEDSMLYEHRKHDGSYPIIGVNTFRNPHGDQTPKKLELARSTEDEKQSQLKRLAEFHARNANAAPAALDKLQRTVIENGNVFTELVNTVRVCSLGQITNALF